jgi:dienelactone hydrolase
MSRSVTRSFALFSVLFLSSNLLCGNAFARSPMLVEFQGAAQPLGSLQQRTSSEGEEVPKHIPGDRIQGFFAKPEGSGPFPAIVALHGCDGLRYGAVQGASDRLVSWGYAALLVDSFTTRSIDHACTPEKYAAEERNILNRTFDAYGALLFLARQPFVDPRRVAVVGVSQGGMVTLSVAEERTFELFVNPSNLAFRAAAALYPPCSLAGARPSIPTLILVGELDDWTPAKDCARTIARWGSASPPVQLVTYPGAYHSFDTPTLQPGRMMFGHWLEYNAEAAEDAHRRIRAFLTEHLDK